MRPAGTGLFALGAVLVGAMVIWGWVGFYISAVPVMMLLGGAGIALMAVGSRLNRGSQPNKAVDWRPADATALGETPTEPSPTSVDAPQATEEGNDVICPHCGTLTRAGSGFCGECGTKLASVVAPAPSAAAQPAAPAMAPPPPPFPPTPPPSAPAPPGAPPSAAPAVVTAPPTPVEPAVVSPSPAVEAAPAAGNPFMIGAPPGLAVPTPAQSASTESGDEIEATRVSPRRKSPTTWRLELPDGQRHSLSAGAALIGRTASADARWPGASLISVVDSSKTVSKTHAVFEADAAGLWVTDLHSSNGVLIELSGGLEADVEPGARTAVLAGSTVLLGDFAISVDKA